MSKALDQKTTDRIESISAVKYDTWKDSEVLFLISKWEHLEEKTQRNLKKFFKEFVSIPAMQKAFIDECEEAVKLIADLAPVAQNFILENAKDLQADLDLMTKKAPEYSRLSGNFWEYLADNVQDLPRKTVAALLERDDVPRAFVKAANPAPAAKEEKPVRESRSSRKASAEPEPEVKRGRGRPSKEIEVKEKSERHSRRAPSAKVEEEPKSRRHSDRTAEKVAHNERKPREERHVHSSSRREEKPVREERKPRHSHKDVSSDSDTRSSRKAQISRGSSSDAGSSKGRNSLRAAMRQVRRPSLVD